MVREEPPHIDSSLDPIRAAIQMVADGSATRVTVYTPDTARLLPAARVLARTAGVGIESGGVIEPGPEVEVRTTPRIA